MKKILFLLGILLSLNSFASGILAKSWLVADSNGAILDEKNMNQVQPIASITKLMTVMVVLDSNQDINESYKLKKFNNLNLTRTQLIDLAIIRSDNDAADMLCKIYIRGYRGCIEDMNLKAESLGMRNTIFYDSTGIDNRNVSSASDLIKMLRAAENYKEITHASTQTKVGVDLPYRTVKYVKNKTKNKKHKPVAVYADRHIQFSNTNPLVAKYDVVVSKTGYVRASGGCLAMSAIVDGVKKYYIILNSKTTKTRIIDMEKLILKSKFNA